MSYTYEFPASIITRLTLVSLIDKKKGLVTIICNCEDSMYQCFDCYMLALNFFVELAVNFCGIFSENSCGCVRPDGETTLALPSKTQGKL